MKKLFYILSIFLFTNLFADVLKIGVLNYGTVNWELDVIKHHKLDKKYGFDLQPVQLASKNAQLIALRGNSVDMIVNDWIWVNTQKSRGKNFVFYPYSKATGTLCVKVGNGMKTLEDLKDRELGIAGGVDDKTWIILRAYAKQKYGLDLKKLIKPVYATAPILYKKMEDNSLEASINYWHFNSMLEKFDVKPLVFMEDVFAQFGIKNDIPLVGWTFSQQFASKNRSLIDSFLKASFEAKDILNSSDEEWERLKPMMNLKDEADFEPLKDGFRKTIIKNFTKENLSDIKKVFKILFEEGKEELVGESKTLDDNIFYRIK